MCVEYYRHMDNEYFLWRDHRHTGLRVTWQFTEPDGVQLLQEVEQHCRYLQDNTHFTLLANIIHEQQGITGEMEELLKEKSREKQEKYEYDQSIGIDYSVGSVGWMENISSSSSEPIYTEEISKDSLEQAALLYFEIFFHPDYNREIPNFYSWLIHSFSLETVLKDLARILFVAKEKQLREHYYNAKAYFDKITTVMRLQYRDVAHLTMAASEMELYPELENHQVNPNVIQSAFHLNYRVKQIDLLNLGESHLEGMINHPAHISYQRNISAFIPFCFLGDLQIGKDLGSFQVPVCSLFREKVVRGQVCYEADVNQYKENTDNWEEALNIGFSFFVDTNDEYDVRNLLEKRTQEAETNTTRKFSPVLRDAGGEKTFSILLETISIHDNTHR